MTEQRRRRKKTDLLKQLQDRLEIEPDALDDELIEHPVLLEKVAQKYVYAVSIRDGKKDNLKMIEGRITDACRDALIKNGVAKPTVKQVEAALAQDPEFIRERSEYLDACANADKWQALKEAYSARGFALHSLANIYVARLKAEAGVYEN
jgi:hypothetical protein